MGKTEKYRPSMLFTVRVWTEENELGEREWRGTARFLPDGQEHPFRGWSALIALLEQMSGEGD